MAAATGDQNRNKKERKSYVSVDGRGENARRLQSNQIEKIGWRAPTGFLHKNSIVGRFKFCLLCAGPFIRCAVEMFVIQLGLGAELTKQATRKKQIAEIRDGTFATRKRDKIAEVSRSTEARGSF